LNASPNSLIRRLDWDSDHFGFEVYEVCAPELGDKALAVALNECREAGATLAYWAACAERCASHELLREFGGKLMDCRTTYGCNLYECPDEPILLDWTFVRSPKGPASPDLVGLALLAGAFSRFRIDPQMPNGAFERMYGVWIERSCQGELADCVIEGRSISGELAGMVTVSIRAGTGVIGLIAVREWARGKGLGEGLVRAAHDAMWAHGVERARVVTQGANLPGCRLYERCGYAITSVENVHHFWLR